MKPAEIPQPPQGGSAVQDPNWPDRVIITKRCLLCNSNASVSAPLHRYLLWAEHGWFVQHAFAELSADDRETLISGSHGACFDQAMPNEEEDEEDPR